MKATLETRSGQAALIAVIVGAVLLAASVAAIIVGPLSTTFSPRTPESLLGVLAAEPKAEDALPTIDGEPYQSSGFFDPETARLVASDSQGSYWAASSADGDVCIITQPSGESTTGSSCADLDRFAREGVWMSMSWPGGSLSTYVLPDGTRFEDLPGSLRPVGSNVLAGDTSDESPQVLTSVDGRVSIYVAR